MLDLIWDAIEALFDWGGDAIDTVAEVASNVDIGDVLLLGGAIYVTHLTVNSIRDELKNRQELKAKGVTHVLIEEFMQEHGHTVVSFAALNDQNKQVGTLSMKASSCSGLHQGQKIYI